MAETITYNKTAAAQSSVPKVNPNVMQQFNAIRSRLQVQQPEIETINPIVTVDHAASDKRIKAEFGKGETALVGYALNSQPRSKAEFEQAYKIYRKVGNKVPGFTFLEPGVLETIRSGFETVIGNPLRSAASAVEQLPSSDTSIDTTTIGPEGRPLTNTYGSAYNAAKTVVPSILREAATPEGAGAMAGTVAVAPAAKGLHLLKQAATVGLGAGTGSTITDIATGSFADNPQKRTQNFLQQTAIAGLGQGITGAFKMAVGQGLSRKAQEQAAGDLMTMLKREAGPLSNDPDGLKIYGSTIKGANDIITVGIKALRGDVDTVGKEIVEDLTAKRLDASARINSFVSNLKEKGLNAPPIRAASAPTYISKAVPGRFSADQFVTDFSRDAPFTLSNQASADVKKYVRQLAKQGNILLDNIGDADAFAKVETAMQATREKIVTTLTSNYSKNSSAVQATQTLRAEQLVAQHIDQLNKFTDFAVVLHYMRQSIGPQGFDPTLMQKLVQYKSGQKPSSLLDKAGDAVFRDVDDRLMGTDKPIIFGMPMSKVPFAKHIPMLKDMTLGKEIGTNYVGKVRGTYPRTEAISAQKTLETIHRYMEEK